MIEYDAGYLGVSPCLLVKFSGSVVPKALCWAIPSALCAIGLFFYWGGDDTKESRSVSNTWVGYSFILGFLIVYRMQQAYVRFWEGATLTNELRAEWIDACQSLFAYCTDKPDKKADVDKFQHMLVRLLSMLHRAALERLNLNDVETFAIVDNKGFDPAKLEFLSENPDRVEIVFQWILRLIVKNMRLGVIDVPPPILSRSFAEVSAGLIKLQNVMKITQIPVPFPYVQMTIFLLMFHCYLTPIIASLIMHNWRWAGCLAFMSVFCLWAIYYIAQEIECPFGCHKNNLPVYEMQNDMNRVLSMLLHDYIQTPPEFDFSQKDRKIVCKRQRTGRVTERQLIEQRHGSIEEMRNSEIVA